MNADDKESLIRKIHEALGGDGWAYSNWGHAELRSHRQELEAVADLFATATARATKAEQELATCRVALEKTRVEADALMMQVPGWREIESAPKDGAEVLAWCPGIGVRVLVWTATGWALEGTDHDYTDYEPTHWQPLPLPPKEKTT